MNERNTQVSDASMSASLCPNRRIYLTLCI